MLIWGMITSLVSLVLLLLPGYCLLHMSWIRQKMNLREIDGVLFGPVVWLFYIVATVLFAVIIIPGYTNHVLWFNYILGAILTARWLMTDVVRRFASRSGYKFTANITQLTLGGTLPFVASITAFTVLMTLYTPLIYQYDALASYLIEGKQLVDSSASLSTTWPTFGDSMPVLPIVYSWFFVLTDCPVLRLIPVFLFLLTILLIFAMGRRFSPGDPSVAYISVVSLVSTVVLHWYMAKTSLYLDLIFVFFAASSVYALTSVVDDGSSTANYLMLGMNLAILALSKEQGLFQAWFVVSLLLFLHYRKTTHNLLRGLVVSAFLLSPFVIFHFGFSASFSYYDISTFGSMTTFRSLLLLLFLPLLLLALKGWNFRAPTPNLSRLIAATAPLTIPLLFFTHTFVSLGVPFGNLSEPYIQRLLELGMKFAYWKPTDTSFLRIPELFATNTLMAPNLIPFLFFFLSLLGSGSRGNNLSNLLVSWFLYSLFVFYFVSYGSMEGASVRGIMPLAIPVALMVGNGVRCLTSHSSWPDWIGIAAYTSATSVFLAYIWFAKLDGSEWWLRNLDSLTTQFAKASYLEILIYATPWVLLVILDIDGKRGLLRSNIFPKRFWSLTCMALLLVSAVTPIAIVSQASKYPKTWDPTYYDEADSVRPYQNYWFTPILDSYRLSDDNYTTIGFGVTPLEYFLERPFIDLAHPRNWLIYLPLLQSLTNDELLSYLETLNASYFLIPTEIYHTRAQYEAALETSTLFQLIATRASFKGSGGNVFRFERTARFDPFELYTLTAVRPWSLIDVEKGEYYTAYTYDDYRILHDSVLDCTVVLWNISASVMGWRALRYTPGRPLDLSNVETIILGANTSSAGHTLELRLGSEKPLENRIGWRIYLSESGPSFFELNMSKPTSDLVKGEFDKTDVRLITFGFTPKSNTEKDVQLYLTVSLNDS